MSTEIEKQANPLMLINLALEKSMDIDKLSRLFDLQERWEKKESEKAFYAAFANFQKDCPEIKKTKKADFPTRTGGRMTYSYVPLSEICKQIRNPLAKNGLSYRWEFQEANGIIECTCIVSHLSGHSKTSKLSGPKDDSGQKNTLQQTGSTHTYLQRYSLIGALGISSADVDNDGRSQPEKPKQQTKEEKEKMAAVTDRFKKEIALIKTPTEIKVNYKETMDKARAEGANTEELKVFIIEHGNKLTAALKKADIKDKEVTGEKLNAELP